MQKLLALTLVFIAGSFGVPAGLVAQAQAPSELARISGGAVDAGGRALVNQRVELDRAGAIVNSTNTGSRGEWSFTNVSPGDYVVRMVVNGHVAGIPVSVTSGQMVTSALIVAPSAAAPSAALAPAALALILGGVAAAVITTVVAVSGS